MILGRGGGMEALSLSSSSGVLEEWRGALLRTVVNSLFDFKGREYLS